MNIPSAETRTKPGENRAGVTSRTSGSPGSCLRRPALGTPPDTEIRSDKQVHRRVLGPIGSQFIDLQKRHLIYYRIAVAAGGGEQPIDLFPTLVNPSAVFGGGSRTVESAPGKAPGADASPRAVPRGLSPEPVRTAFSTALAFPRSSRSST